jgi:hypothetical protein
MWLPPIKPIVLGRRQDRGSYAARHASEGEADRVDPGAGSGRPAVQNLSVDQLAHNDGQARFLLDLPSERPFERFARLDGSSR